MCQFWHYLCSILDGASRAIVHWEIREQMTEADVECILTRGHEAHPNERPRIISDNGPQFIAKDFKEFIRLTGTTHVRTAPYYPQSNGKIERWHKTLKADAIRPGQPTTLDDRSGRIWSGPMVGAGKLAMTRGSARRRRRNDRRSEALTAAVGAGPWRGR